MNKIYKNRVEIQDRIDRLEIDIAANKTELRILRLKAYEGCYLCHHWKVKGFHCCQNCLQPYQGRFVDE